LININCFDLMF